MSDQLTYLIKSDKLYKIGKSKDPKKRLAQIKTANPTVRLICYGKGISEKELHKMYCNNRISGEWFKLRKRDVECIIRYIKNEMGTPTDYSDYLINFGKYNGTMLVDMKTSEQIRYLKWYVRQVKRGNACRYFRWYLATIQRLT